MNLRESDNRYTGGLSQWINRRLTAKGVKLDSKKVGHSWRHTVATRLKAVDVQDHTISEIVGHKVEGMTVGRYGKKLEPAKLRDALEMLVLPV